MKKQNPLLITASAIAPLLSIVCYLLQSQVTGLVTRGGSMGWLILVYPLRILSYLIVTLCCFAALRAWKPQSTAMLTLASVCVLCLLIAVPPYLGAPYLSATLWRSTALVIPQMLFGLICALIVLLIRRREI